MLEQDTMLDDKNAGGTDETTALRTQNQALKTKIRKLEQQVTELVDAVEQECARVT